MAIGDVWLRMLKLFGRGHLDVKSFERESRELGGLASGVDRGFRTIPVEKVVGSVGRSHNLRSDFFYRTGQAMTQRFVRIGQAMREGKTLPPLELYKLKRRPADQMDVPVSEYYVVDGHHRVAMARKLGQDFLDAHVTEFKPPATTGQLPPTEPPKPDEPAPPTQPA